MTMTQFTKPSRLNGTQLVAELATAGVVVTGYPRLDSDGFWLDIDSAKVATATTVVANHAGIDANTGLPVVAT